jgi:hypothetical protein
MTFDFYLELASRAMDSELLELLRFPLDETPLAARHEFSARWWEHGKTRRMKARNREKMIERISSTEINALELKWHSESRTRVAGLALVDACLDFFPSPMSQLWAEVPLHRLKSHSEEISRRNFRNKESVLTREHRLPYPSTLECFLRMDAAGEKLEDAQLQELAVAWIRAATPPRLAQQQIFGYGCVHGKCRRMGFVQSLGFPEIDQLGEKFENVYPILIGPRNSCEAAAKELGSIAAVERLSDNSPSSILSINPERIRSVVNGGVLHKWLVPRIEARDVMGPKGIVVPPKPKTT